MKLNWKVRFKNGVWLAGFFALIVSFVYDILGLLGVAPAITQSTVMTIIDYALKILGMIGVITDPTTAGLGDSDRAMTYAEPWDDNINKEE